RVNDTLSFASQLHTLLHLSHRTSNLKSIFSLMTLISCDCRHCSTFIHSFASPLRPCCQNEQFQLGDERITVCEHCSSSSLPPPSTPTTECRQMDLFRQPSL